MKKTIFIIFTQLLFITSIYAQTWEFVGLDSMVIKQLYVSGDTIYAGTAVRSGANINSGLYFTSNGGNNWVQLDSSLGGKSIIDLEFLPGRNDTFYLVKRESPYPDAGKLYKTTNRGSSWQIITPLEEKYINWLSISIYDWNELYALEIIQFPAGSLEYLHKSTDAGETWTEIGSFPSDSHGNRVTVAIDLRHGSTLYAAVGTQLFDDYFYKSIDKGNNWIYISEPPTVEQELITDPTIPDRIFMFSGYYLTEDGGYTWTVADSGLQDVNSYFSFYFDPVDNSTFYNLRKDGLYVSENNPIYWQLVEGSDSLPLDRGGEGFQYWDIGQLSNVFIDTLNNKIYVGTAKGIYRKDLITNVEEEITIGQPSTFILQQNFPNPFNPATTISYQIPQKSFTTIKVYDLLGKEMKTLVNGEKLQGHYKVDFNGTELTSGVYFYILTAITENGERIIEGKKMILIK